ncbi:MAG: hypothetical protein KKF33_16060, partial [Alphaproteobacteria bacterium]|nr:hypothetical protein [Alphaproteobacteria bacterium]
MLDAGINKAAVLEGSGPVLAACKPVVCTRFACCLPAACLFAIAEQTQHHQEQVDEVEVEVQRAHDG